MYIRTVSLPGLVYFGPHSFNPEANLERKFKITEFLNENAKAGCFGNRFQKKTPRYLLVFVNTHDY